MKLKKISVLAISTVLLAACSSSGGGSGVSNPTPTPTPTPTVSRINGTATYANNKYVYTVSTESEPMVLSAISTGDYSIVQNSGSIINGPDRFVVSGAVSKTQSKYTSFGAYSSKDGTKLDVFAVGSTPTVASAVPTIGTAVYNGKALQVTGFQKYNNATAAINVDFGNKTIQGTTLSTNLNGTLSGASFSGTATNGTATGTFSGGFYGPAAEELAGTTVFAADPTKNFAFGGKK